MVLGLLAVEAVGQVPAVVPEEGGGGGYCQRDALIGWAEQAVDAVGHILLDAGGVAVPPTKNNPHKVLAFREKICYNDMILIYQRGAEQL